MFFLNLLNVFKLTTLCKNKNQIADTIPLTWIRKFHIKDLHIKNPTICQDKCVKILMFDTTM